MNYPRSIAFAVLWLMLSQTPAVAQDFEKGLAAARAGNFAVAVAEWRPLANDGHVEAQFNLGAIYEAGLEPIPQSSEYWSRDRLRVSNGRRHH